MLKKILFLFSFLFLVMSVITFSIYQGVFNITKINLEVTDAEDNFKKQSLLRAAQKKLNYLKGQPIFFFSLNETYEKLLKDPRIKEIKLKRKFPNQIRVYIRPKQVSASMMSFAGGLHTLTNDGDVMPVEFSKQSLDRPILRGTNFHKNKELRLLAIELLHEIPEKGIFSRQNISEIRYDRKNGFIVYLNSHASIVKLGKNEFKKKSSYIERAMSYLQSQEMIGRVIDARYSKKVVVKLRNEP